MAETTEIIEPEGGERSKVESWRLHVLMEAGYPVTVPGALIGALASFGKAFLPGTGELDIQTHYNGATGDNVPAFRDAASYIFGVAGHAAGIPLDVLKAGGGAVNLRQY